MKNTIAAISTAIGQGGIGIIRMSGEDCFEVLEKMFVPKNKGDIRGNSIKYGHIINARSKENIDEVLVSYFIKPKSYTTENMCEINTHGGLALEREILKECLKNGARLAEPGEFTQRAFLNGRIDLSQAEAVMEIINSKSEKEIKIAENQLEGRLSKKIQEIENILLNAMADIEASIDYPEYDVEETTNDKLNVTLEEALLKLNNLEKNYENGRIIKEGIRTAIVGKPNVGKSSILNLLLNEDRAIVSAIEGTTRDIIEENINIEGIPLKIIDTAGIRETNDEIEKIGIKKSINIINQADLIIAVFDNSRPLDDEDKEIIELVKGKNCIFLLNKNDLKEESQEMQELNRAGETIEFSAKTEKGLDKLYKCIENMFNLKEIDINDDEMITNLRQKEHIDNAIKNIEEAQKTVQINMPIDIDSIYIKEALIELGKITGKDVSEDIIKEIFSKFCLGK